MMKQCSKCKETKEEGGFTKNRAQKMGLNNYCRLCLREYRQSPENKKRKAQWRKSEKGKAYTQKCSLEFRKKYYNLTLDEYKQMVIEQNNCCAICKLPETMKFRGKIKSLTVDHDHQTGKIRALLCSNCNRGIGLLRDDINIIAESLQYLIKHQPIQADLQPPLLLSSSLQ